MIFWIILSKRGGWHLLPLLPKLALSKVFVKASKMINFFHLVVQLMRKYLFCLNVVFDAFKLHFWCFSTQSKHPKCWNWKTWVWRGCPERFSLQSICNVNYTRTVHCLSELNVVNYIFSYFPVKSGPTQPRNSIVLPRILNVNLAVYPHLDVNYDFSYFYRKKNLLNERGKAVGHEPPLLPFRATY